MSPDKLKSNDTVIPTMAIETITPEVAAKYLAVNCHNRKIRPGNLKHLTTALKNGEWQFNGDPIRFDTDGNLIDGQHRCLAVIAAAVPIETVIIRGLDPDSFHTIDTGRTRGGCDVLSIAGVECNPAVLAGTIRMVFLSKYLSNDWDGGSMLTGNRLTNQHILDINLTHPGISTAVLATAGSDRKFCRALLTPAGAAFSYYWLSGIDEEGADAFFNWLEYCDNISRSHPVNMLRTKLSGLAGIGVARNSRDKRLMYALVFRAWNAIRDREQLKLLKWSRTSKFPIPH